ncbi:peptidoglycan DD-metalloendopeptidase family protein [Halomonas sp. M20]|uniref:peptidoglycan DD-metalloendopeptidase family protein n=1 Tax=Halomonas sp. M20 TaxID=2763264 RepID=UPI001D09FCE7|nr:peptidoglycan DD-metalloendopeptidase family protein [Halomonas sp. M20]
MRKAFLVTALALGVAGCAGPNTTPDVRDLSVSREAQSGESVTVQQGDTLYGIAWRQNMDFRELARINGITPPYRLQPGQTLQLGGNAQAAPGGTPAAVANPSLAQNDMAAGATGAAGVAGTQAPDWLAPDTEAIERNRRMTSRPLESSSEASSRQASSDEPSRSPSSNDQATARAEEGQDTSGQGPIYNYGTPGADGQLSAQDRAEREAMARQRAQARSQSQPSTQENVPSREEPVQSGNQQPSSQDAQQNNQAARQPDDTAAREEATVAGPAADAGTAVAGGADAPTAQQRTYTPVENVSWQWPVEGQVVGRFSDGSSITAGIDIAGQKGQPVKAAAPGIVVYAGDGVRGYGNLILLKHNDSFLSAYAYNDSLRVSENDVVEAGEVIATMGDTDADGVKLHFEVRQDGQPQDPLKFLPRR